MQLDLPTLERQSKSKKSNIVNVASVPQRSPFRYPGGKTWFVPCFRDWIKGLNKKPDVLIEPFAGGGIIGLTAAFENLTSKVVLAEIDENVSYVWEAIIYDDFEKLAKNILDFDLTPDNARKTLEVNARSTISKAFQTILRNRVSHGGIMAPGAGLIKNGESGKGISSRWYPSTLAKRIRAIGLIREKLEFIHGSAFDLIPKYSGKKGAAYFIDPPYTAGGKRAGRRLYSHHSLDHEKLFSELSKVSGSVLMTYDVSDEISILAKTHGFDTSFIPMKNTHHAKMYELIIGNHLASIGQND
ncbi:MAG: DNA adenine methylase [Bdellovibrionales bacterium]|nr:DNA adenine methylase [Bdellovibrionales bacterium]